MPPDFAANTASLATLVAAAESVESRVLGWLHSLPASPADLSIADLNSAAQALWRLTAVRKTLSLIAGYAPPTRPRGFHVMPDDADPYYYPFESKEEYDAHLAWGLQMSLASGTPYSDGSPAKNALGAEPDADAGPAPAAMATLCSAQTPDSPKPQPDPAAQAAPSPEKSRSSPTPSSPFPPSRALSVPHCPAIPGKLPSIPSAAPAPPADPIRSSDASESSPREAPQDIAEPNPVARASSPEFLPRTDGPGASQANSNKTLKEVDEPRPEGPAANSPARQGGVRPAVSPEARRAGTDPSAPSPPFPRPPLEFGVLPRPSRPP